MGKRFGVLPAKTSPRFSRHEPSKNLILVFMEKERKRRFLANSHIAIGKACMKILKNRIDDGVLQNEDNEKPPIPEGYSEQDVAGIEAKRFSMLPKELKTYKAKLVMWAKKNNALERASKIIAENDLDAARDFVEERGDLPFERYKFQTLEDAE
jgi:hypothetical protein